ncbi:MAG TPA: DUF481 domain-containing protein [Kofleriaceae bacterium]|nr:DUF481 domain-containing protein [Kofleriaceae bacterium]
MRRTGVLAAAAAALAITGGPARAQSADPAFKYGTKEERAEVEKVEQVEWKAAALAGLIMTTGNSRVTTFSAGGNASRKEKGNKFSLEGGAAYARSSIFLAVDGNMNGVIDPSEVSRPSQTTTRAWYGKGRYDRFLTDNNSLYVVGGLAGDRPAGKDLVGNGQLGYSRQVFQNEVHLLVAEVGYDYTYESLVGGESNSIHSLRTFAGYGGKLSDETGVDGSVEALFNVNEYDTPAGTIDRFQDNRVTSRMSITTKMFGDLSFRFAFEARYDNAPSPRPPFAIPYAAGFAPLAESLDTKTEASLIYNFL